MTYRRLLTSLAAHSPSPSASASTSRLIPPYAQTLARGTPSSPLRPPYEHALPLPSHEIRGRSLKSPRKFEMILSSPAASVASRDAGQKEWKVWADRTLSDEKMREKLVARWREVIGELAQIKAGSVTIPQVPYHSLSSHLSSPETIESIKNIGAVVVRDVVPDNEAIEWARSILVNTGERGGKATYWHPSLLSARSNPSVLTANALMSSSLLPNHAGDGVYVTASSITEGLSAQPTTPSLSATASDADVSAWSNPRSILSHLTLTPSIPTALSVVSPSILAAEYALLRPLFRAAKSKISFYSPEGYLNEQNWDLIDTPLTSSSSRGAAMHIEMDLPHLANVQTPLPELLPGDMIIHHTSLPVHTSAGSGQVFLPLHPVPKAADGHQAWAEQQREAFEKGLPPPGISVEGLWEVEGKGSRELLGGRAGREAMGYE